MAIGPYCYEHVSDADLKPEFEFYILAQPQPKELFPQHTHTRTHIVAVARDTGRSMLKSALFAALARLALGLSKTLASSLPRKKASSRF